jgi:hypothetical protein
MMRFPSIVRPRYAGKSRFSYFAHYPLDPGHRSNRNGGRPTGARRRAVAPGRAALYSGTMEYVLPILVVLAILAVLASLFGGLINMAMGGDPKRANMFMRYRVWLQGLALLLFLVFMMLYRR